MTASTKRHYSSSKKDFNRKIRCDREKNIDCSNKPLCPRPNNALIECGMPSSKISFTTTGQTFNTSLVTVDTSCIIKPVVDIYFSSQVNVILQPEDGVTPPGTAEVVLQYDLICRTDGSGDKVIESFIYRRFLTATTSSQRLETIDTFSFNRCLFPKPCQGCMDYFIRITAVTISVNNIIQ